VIKALRVAGLIVLALLAQLLLPRFGGRLFGYCDFLLLVVVGQAIAGPRVQATLIGTACGLLEDAFTGLVFGLGGFAKTVVGFAGSTFDQRFMIEAPLTQALVFAGATLLQELLRLILLFLLFGLGGTAGLFPDILGLTIGNAVGGTLLLRLARLDRRLTVERRERRRRARLAR
jgi:rod shape-determining protein MreD